MEIPLTKQFTKKVLHFNIHTCKLIRVEKGDNLNRCRGVWGHLCPMFATLANDLKHVPLSMPMSSNVREHRPTVRRGRSLQADLEHRLKRCAPRWR